MAFLSTSLFADPVSLDSLPTPVQDSLKGILQKSQETVADIETYQWGPATIYKITINLDGKPYLEVHIADTGKVVRTDENSDAMENSDDDAQDDASPSPSASPHGRAG